MLLAQRKLLSVFHSTRLWKHCNRLLSSLSTGVASNEVVRPLSAFPAGSKSSDDKWTRYLRMGPEDVTTDWKDFLDGIRDLSCKPALSSDVVGWCSHRLDHDDEEAEQKCLPKQMWTLRLPTAIPGFEDKLLPDTLFIRQDDFGVLQRVREFRKTYVYGNPGIGKSWFQFQFLLFMMRPDLYCAMTGKSQLPLDSYGNAQPPKTIIRLVRPNQYYLFFLGEQRPQVHFINYDGLSGLYMLHYFNSETTVAMWEPDEGDDRIRKNLPLPLFATVSPDEQRYKEFEKDGAMRVYMPCPLTAELLTIAAVYRERGVNPDGLYSDELVLQRLAEFGPYLRHVFPEDEAGVDSSRRNRSDAMAKLNLEEVSQLFYNEVSSDGGGGSHWFLKYDVNRCNQQQCYLDGSDVLQVASQATLEEVKRRRSELSLSKKIEALIRFNESDQIVDSGFSGIWLEDVFAERGKEGLKWQCRPRENNVWQLERIKFENLVREKVPRYEEMVEGVLYCQMQAHFPFLDGVWKQEGKLYGFQATVSSQHAKAVDTWNKAREKLAIPKNVTMTVYYVVLSRFCKDGQGWNAEGALPASKFWKNVGSGREQIKEAETSLCFYVLQPPRNFSCVDNS